MGLNRVIWRTEAPDLTLWTRRKEKYKSEADARARGDAADEHGATGMALEFTNVKISAASIGPLTETRVLTGNLDESELPVR